MPPPVRIKVYGLISLTKRTYLLWVALAGVGLLALLVFWVATVGRPTPAERAGHVPLYVVAWRDYGPWMIVAGALAGAAEAFFVLRRFRRAEAEQKQAPATDPTPKGN